MKSRISRLLALVLVAMLQMAAAGEELECQRELASLYEKSVPLERVAEIRKLLGMASTQELNELLQCDNLSIRLAAAWEYACRKVESKEHDHLGSWYCGFFAAAVRTEPPAGWCRGIQVMTTQRTAPWHESRDELWEIDRKTMKIVDITINRRVKSLFLPADITDENRAFLAHSLSKLDDAEALEGNVIRVSQIKAGDSTILGVLPMQLNDGYLVVKTDAAGKAIWVNQGRGSSNVEAFKKRIVSTVMWNTGRTMSLDRGTLHVYGWNGHFAFADGFDITTGKLTYRFLTHR